MGNCTILDNSQQHARKNIVEHDSDTNTFAFERNCQPTIQTWTTTTVPARPLHHDPDRRLDGKAALVDAIVQRDDAAVGLQDPAVVRDDRARPIAGDVGDNEVDFSELLRTSNM